MSLNEARTCTTVHPSSGLTTIDSVLHVETTIARPVCEVWPIFVDFRRWYTEYEYEVLSGPALGQEGFQEGQLLKITPLYDYPQISDSSNPEAPRFFIMKNLKVVPPREIVVKMAGAAFDFKRYTNFYAWRLIDQQNSTIISVDNYLEGEVEGATDEWYRELHENFYRSWSEAFKNLARVLRS